MTERTTSNALMKLVGLTSLTLWALTIYFIAFAAYLDGRAYTPADHALVMALGILAGACAIPGAVLGLHFLSTRDAGLLEANAEHEVADAADI